jgi:hypothetical protein
MHGGGAWGGTTMKKTRTTRMTKKMHRLMRSRSNQTSTALVKTAMEEEPHLRLKLPWLGLT